MRIPRYPGLYMATRSELLLRVSDASCDDLVRHAACQPTTVAELPTFTSLLSRHRNTFLLLLRNCSTSAHIEHSYRTNMCSPSVAVGLTVVYTVLSLRVITWTFRKKPYMRLKTLRAVTPQVYVAFPPTFRHKQVFIDAFELSCNLRGTGWNWSQYLQIPQETRPTNSAPAFAATSFLSLILHLAMFDIFQYSIQWLGPSAVGSAEGGSIFDARGMMIYSVVQAGYHVLTIIGVLVFRQDTSLWPPAFRSPWFSTSLTEFWAKRWHQLFRDVFIAVGGKPLSLFLGRLGGILGVFIISGVLHALGLWGMGRGTDFPKVGGFFFMNGLGICFEHLWRSTIGQRVGGWYGWVWTMVWVIGWGHTIMEAWATKGLIGSAFLPQDMRITTHIFGPLQ
ncbi:putative long-chain-alcohol O-fatty-acyltransferase 2 [Termitomyces sp. T112]|nr:putative long-chain-alcohol O-fatty-acyltransferase 2 [Termitomyces sp. T112]